MADFEVAYEATRRHEGGYVWHALDKGGETYSGISRRNFPTWSGWPLIDAHKGSTQFLTALLADTQLPMLVRQFYLEHFWNANNLSSLMLQEAAAEIFDTGVNMGRVVAAKFLQEGLNLTNRNGKDYPNIGVDGIIGVKTLAIANRHPNPPALLKVLNLLQGARYIDICRRDPSQEVFLFGWLNRV